MEILKKSSKVLFTKFVSSLTAVALILITSFGPHVAIAASMTSSKDTATRTIIGLTADHVVSFTLPSTITFDQSGTIDTLRVDFPATFSQGGTWQTTDFTFNDGTARSINAIAAGAGTIDVSCSDGTDNVGVAIDTTNLIFTVKPCGASFVASGAAAAVTFTIFGTTTTGTGTLTNPGSVAATTIDIAMCDETASCTSSFTTTHSSQIAFAITDNDQVTVTAIVGSSITFDIDTDTNPSTENGPTYTVALGSITTSDTRVSGSTDGVNIITLEGDTSGAGGMVVTVKNANGSNGLVSASAPSDNINSADGAMNAGVTENYGLCVATAALTGFSRAAPYNTGSCALNTNTNDVQALTTTGEDILNTGGAPVSGGHAEVVVNAAITTATVAHNDYTDTLTFIATGTF